MLAGHAIEVVVQNAGGWVVTPHRSVSSAVRKLFAKVRDIVAIPVVRSGLAVLAVGVALWLVRNQLEQISLSGLLAALRATPPSAMALSALFTGLSFACLAVVEWQALKIVGRPQRPLQVAIASFASNAVSIVMGFGVVSGTAVRLRTYAFAKLKPSEIARLVVLLQGATLVSGIVALGLSLLRWLPRALARSADGWLILARDLALLAPIALWFVLFRNPGEKSRSSRTVLDRLVSLAAGLGDWLFSGAALFVLSWFVLSPHHIGAFIGFMRVFCLGSLIGSISGVPGGLGVLEAVMLGQQTKGHVHETAAALILYRLIYFLGPLAVTLIGEAARRGSTILPRLLAGGHDRR
jgi:phosphatidylglycerol lysyltransferase